MEQKDFLFPTASNNVYMNNYENNFNLSFLKIERGLSEENASLKEENASLKEENTKLKIINAELERLATLDGLTGLSNYSEIIKQAENFIAESKTFAVVVIDVNNFKKVNDTLGHVEGDRLLTEIASVLKKCFRENDVVGYGLNNTPDKSDNDVVEFSNSNDIPNKTVLGRQGGDEFCILVLLDPRPDKENTKNYQEENGTEIDPTKLTDVMNNIYERLNSNFLISLESLNESLEKEHELKHELKKYPEDVSLAIGYSIYNQGDTVDEMFERADDLMYKDKHKRKS